MLERLLTERVAVLVQGITGRAGRQHAALMRAYGTNIVGGVSGASDRAEVNGLPVFPDCRAAVAATGAEASVIMVPPYAVLAAIIEAIEAGIRLIVSVTEGMPVHDALVAARMARRRGVIWFGPSTPGLAIPGRAKLGFLPDVALLPGPVGLMTKSGTLSYEIGYRLVQKGVGQTLWAGVGGDSVKGTRFADLVPFYRNHEPTRCLVVIGEIGGTEEEELAQALGSQRFDKPVCVLLAGASAPVGVTMGHAGAIIQGERGSVASKTAALEAAGAKVFSSVGHLVTHVVRTAGRS
jgi:succinyl-CoA synthetase alpha subunit